MALFLHCQQRAENNRLLPSSPHPLILSWLASLARPPPPPGAITQRRSQRYHIHYLLVTSNTSKNNTPQEKSLLNILKGHTYNTVFLYLKKGKKKQKQPTARNPTIFVYHHTTQDSTDTDKRREG